jgi:hypothetical protein
MRFLSSPVEKLALLAFLTPIPMLATYIGLFIARGSVPHFPDFPDWLAMIAVILFLAWAAGLFTAGWGTACGAFAIAAAMPLLDYLIKYGVSPLLLPLMGIPLAMLVMGGHHLLTRRGGP